MSNLAPLFAPETVHDRRHTSLWVALSASAGAVNAIALCACQRYVTHVTGTLTRIGADATQFVLLFEYLCVFGCFVLGAMASVWMIDRRRARHQEPMPAAPLFIVAAALAIAAALGMAGLFGPFGRTVETVGDFVLLSILAFAMGLQNASVASSTGGIVRTTHMTGPVTDFSIALATSLVGGHELVVASARRSMMLRGAKISAFVVGAVLGALLSARLQYASFFVPAAVTMVVGAVLRSSLARQRALGYGLTTR